MPFEPQSSDELFDTSASRLKAISPETYPRANTTLLYAILQANSSVHEDIQKDIKYTYDNAYIVSATGEELTQKAREYGVNRREPTRATGVVTFHRDSPASADYVIQQGTIVETVTENPIQYETTETVTLESGTTEVDATVRAVDGGAAGNVTVGTIQAMPSKPTGVDTVTNPIPTGDPTESDTDGDPLIRGTDREGDELLRERVLDTDAAKEGPSDGGIKLALQRTDGVISSTLNTNQQPSTVNGLDPYHSEVVVYGGDTYDIAQTLYDVMSVPNLLRLQGGVNGTKVTETIEPDLLNDTITIAISRPATETFDIEISVVVDSTYAGDEAVKSEIVSYIGGINLDDSTEVGLLIGENVRLNEVVNRVERLDGVTYANVTLADVDGDGTDDSTTTNNGIPIVSIDSSSVARVDAENITVTSTQQ